MLYLGDYACLINNHVCTCVTCVCVCAHTIPTCMHRNNKASVMANLLLAPIAVLVHFSLLGD